MRTPEDAVIFFGSQPHIVAALSEVEALGLPDCWIAAGFLRNAVWNHLGGYKQDNGFGADVDVVFLDRSDDLKARELDFSQALKNRAPYYDWEVKNQARMHHRNNDAPYKNTEDAIAHFLETPTAIGARTVSGEIEIIAPFGVKDLLEMTLRPTPSGRAKPKEYMGRINSKDWLQRWPRMTVERI